MALSFSQSSSVSIAAVWSSTLGWRFVFLLAAWCLLASTPVWSLATTTRSAGRRKFFQSRPASSSRGRLQSKSSIRMSEMAANMGDQDGLAQVRDRIWETSDMLKQRIQNDRNGTRKRKYKRKNVPETEKERRRLKLVRQAEYQEIMSSGSPSIWSFESLFPDPVWDEKSIKRDLFEVKERDLKTKTEQANGVKPLPEGRISIKQARAGTNGSTVERLVRPMDLKSVALPLDSPLLRSRPPTAKTASAAAAAATTSQAGATAAGSNSTYVTGGKVDRSLTRMVEDKMFGYRRTQAGEFQYETSLMGDGAVKFRDGVRLGNALAVNGDRLTYMARKELLHGRIEEARELYERAIEMDPRDGRAYLGLSRCAERRRDLKLARDWLRAGIQHSKASTEEGSYDQGGNPFLLQALGCLEEKRGELSTAESLYIQAAKSRPSHTAAWIALAQIRTRKLGQPASAGRTCYEAAERELKKVDRKPSAHLYTAWGGLEYKDASDTQRARKLFQSALEIDPKCSAAWLQLGVMEADNENWDKAEECFEKVLKFDQRNSRVLQAYALMETKRPNGSSRKAIDLFERALKVNPRDAGVLQPYALYVADLGDIDAARELLRRGTEVNKRHAPVWQAWGVLETRYGSATEARNIFQQGIWACAQLAGNQSGGYHCARLWQAWGVLEAREGEYAAARRCFSRALDADSRNVPTVTAWTQMEVELGYERDARLIFETSLKKFAPGSDAKMTLWRAYELMEQRSGNVDAAQQVYQRSVREAFNTPDDHPIQFKQPKVQNDSPKETAKNGKPPFRPQEIGSWAGSSMKGEIWMNDGSIETKIPVKKRNLKANQRP